MGASDAAKTRKRKLKGIDLFCGMGGMSLGMKWAGVEPVAAVDHWDKAIDVYGKNFPAVEGCLGDVSDKEFSDSIVRRWKNKLYLVAGSPPCVNYSVLNQTPDHDVLPLTFIDIAIRLKPKVILMEEVPQLLKHGNFNSVLRRLQTNGYHTEYGVLNSANFGVSQERRRLILIAYKGASRDVIGSLQKTEHVPVKKVLPRCASHDKLTPRLEKRLTDVSVKWDNSYKVLDLDKPSPALSTKFDDPSCWKVIKTPSGYYKLSRKQALALQSFPLNYKVTGVKAHDNKLIGNAVPPKMIHNILRGCQQVIQ